MTIIEYVTEEVERQGHDTTVLDGLQRVAWMLAGWGYALSRAEGKPDIFAAEFLGKMIEPNKNMRGIRTVGVRVGYRVCPSHEEVPRLLESTI